MKKAVYPIFGIVALPAAIIALLLAIFGGDIAESIQPTPSLEESVADLTVRVKDTVIAKLRDRDAVIPSKESSFDWHSTIHKLALGLGVLGLAAAAVSYTRGERRAFAFSAAGLGVVALSWQAMMISLGAILVIVVIFAVLNALGIDLSL